MDRYGKALELDKILALLAAETTMADAADAARSLTPSPYYEEVRRLLDETDAAYRLMAGYGSPSFGNARNVTGALRRAQAGACLSMRELLFVAGTLAAIRTVKEWRLHSGEVATCLDDRFAALTPNKYLEERIISTVVSEEEIADNASPALADIRRKMRAASARVREQLDKMVRSPACQKILQEPIVTIRDGRFVVPVKAEHRSEVAGLVHDTSASGATVFIEPMGSVEANNELKVLASKEAAEIERILFELSAEAGGFADAVAAEYEILTELNLIFAKARLAYKMKAVMPTLANDGHLILKGARHPLIAPDKVVPVDVELGGAFDTLVITGPNTGGKTVTLKTIGLLTLMTQCGLVPPVADGSKLSVFRKVLVDIGDEQSIEQSLSTFSAHMTNLIRILQETDDSSLVLTDELGAGTDPAEGAALATAIIERLRHKGARVVSTTHYAELKAYAINTDGVENGSCEFDVATLRPTYRLLVGVPGRSHAFAILERLGMEPAVVDAARRLVSEEDRRLDEVVSRLEEKRVQAEQASREAESLRHRAAQLEKDAKHRREAMEKQREETLEKAREEARRLVERARAEAQALMNELDAIRKQQNKERRAEQAGEAKSQLRARLKELEDTLDPVTRKRQEGYTLPRPLKAGDSVRLMDIDKQGVVLSPVDKQGMVEVQAGIIRTRVPLKNLRLLDEQGKTQQKGQGGVSKQVRSRAEREVHTEIDLRGMLTDEGVLLADRFIDDAVMGGLARITIIHGKGTGALRSAIHTLLRRHPHVDTFRLGRYGEGETGVTIVELK